MASTSAPPITVPAINMKEIPKMFTFFKKKKKKKNFLHTKLFLGENLFEQQGTFNNAYAALSSSIGMWVMTLASLNRMSS